MRVANRKLADWLGFLPQLAWKYCFMTTLHIGAAGELLVQYRLLKHGVDSARLTTDSGVDLVAYSPIVATALTIQVKTSAVASKAGGKGAMSSGWFFAHDCTADLLALVRLSSDSVWLFTLAEARELAQQHSQKGARQLYWYTDPATAPAGARLEQDMQEFRIESRVQQMFLAR
ncbi:MAG: hypothetical protein CVT64_11130 [Actinobacteria bacterium HGW-Actinobacteria-4]|nr:MAG: hypothetical protein CVT64_11130 [Actinobacteria bacterium HGW-Actinobacteria-4]